MTVRMIYLVTNSRLSSSRCPRPIACQPLSPVTPRAATGHPRDVDFARLDTAVRHYFDEQGV